MKAGAGIGDLNRRLTLLAPVETADGAGGVVRGYARVATVWAHVTPLAGRPEISAEARGAALRYAIVIRRRNGVSTRHRFQDGARIYRVLAARDSADRRFLEIDAEERQD